MKHKLLSLLLVLAVVFTGFSQSTATYTITFDSNWSNATHPHPTNNFPSNAHWSKLVGATHNNNITFLSMGGIATQGIEDVAESGSNGQFFSEVNTAIGNGNASSLIDGDALSTALGQIVIADVTTTENHPLLTLVSMIAPSPDWIVAVNSVELLDTNGDWINESIIDLYPYDAGTDSGLDYTSANADVTPHDPISNAQGVSPFSSEKIGTLTITLESVLGVEEFSSENKVSMFPNPASSTTTIQASRSHIGTVEIYNVIGERVERIANVNSSELTLDLTRFTSGIYLVKIIDIENNETLQKLIKR